MSVHWHDDEYDWCPCDETVHQCPRAGESVTPCCGRAPFELSRATDRLTLDPSLVTCGRP